MNHSYESMVEPLIGQNLCCSEAKQEINICQSALGRAVTVINHLLLPKTIIIVFQNPQIIMY